MDISRIIELEKENVELKRRLEENLNKDKKFKQYQSYIQEMNEDIIILKERLNEQPIMVHIKVKKTRLEDAEKLNFDMMNKHPLFVKIPVSTIRMAGMPSSYIDEISPQYMNSLVSQIESSLRERIIILVDSQN